MPTPNAVALLLRRRLSSAPASPTDLIAAVVSQLRSHNAGAFATAIGDATGTPKIWVGADMGSPALPWVRVLRPMGRREYSSLGNYIETGQVQVSVFASSVTSARTLAAMLTTPNAGGGALDDPALAFVEGSLMSFRRRGQRVLAEPGAGVGAPQVYHAVLTFDYRFSGQIA